VVERERGVVWSWSHGMGVYAALQVCLNLNVTGPWPEICPGRHPSWQSAILIWKEDGPPLDGGAAVASEFYLAIAIKLWRRVHRTLFRFVPPSHEAVITGHVRITVRYWASSVSFRKCELSIWLLVRAGDLGGEQMKRLLVVATRHSSSHQTSLT
jgi:hypothetical protein